MADPARLGIRAYARHRGCSHTAVQKAVTAGRLSELSKANPSGSWIPSARGSASIDPVAADLEWTSNTDELQQRENHREPAPPLEEPAPGQLFPDAQLPGAAAVQEVAPRRPTLASAQAVRTTYLAQIAKLDYEERCRNLVQADGVRIEAFRVAREVRDALLSIPDRMAGELASITNTHELRERLSREIRQALEVLSAAG